MTPRAALVTGASSGIGLAVARLLRDEGFGVTLCARGSERLQDAARALGEGNLLTVVADVGDEADVQRAVRAHAERFGRLDVLVNSAGGFAATRWPDIPTTEADELMRTNLRGPLLVLREALPLLRDAGREHGKALVVTLASVAGKEGQPGAPVYAATKAGVISLSESLQREAAADGVQATAICPGLVATPMVAGAPVPEAEMVQPEDVAEAVRMLLRTSPSCLVPEIVLNRRGAVG